MIFVGDFPFLVANVVHYTVFCDPDGLKRLCERALRYIFVDFFGIFLYFSSTRFDWDYKFYYHSQSSRALMADILSQGFQTQPIFPD